MSWSTTKWAVIVFLPIHSRHPSSPQFSKPKKRGGQNQVSARELLEGWHGTQRSPKGWHYTTLAMSRMPLPWSDLTWAFPHTVSSRHAVVPGSPSNTLRSNRGGWFFSPYMTTQQFATLWFLPLNYQRVTAHADKLHLCSLKIEALQSLCALLSLFLPQAQTQPL